VTVTAVINEESRNAIQLVLSTATAVPGCTPNTSRGVEFAIGANGVTASSLNSYLASGLAALASGRQIKWFMKTARGTVMEWLSQTVASTANVEFAAHRLVRVAYCDLLAEALSTFDTLRSFVCVW